MYESRAIMRYLDDKLPGNKLTPQDAHGKAKMEQWSSVEYSYFSPVAMQIIYQKLMYPMRGMPTDQSIVDASKEKLGPTLDVMDKQLAQTQHLSGADFTLADISFLPYIEYLFAAKEGGLIESRPHVAAWWKRVSERPSWKKAIGQA